MPPALVTCKEPEFTALEIMNRKLEKDLEIIRLNYSQAVDECEVVRTWPLEYFPRVSTGKASGVGFEKVIGYFFTLMIATAIFYWK